MNDLTTINELIEQLGHYTNSWIFENGSIKDDILAIDTRDLLKAFKELEVDSEELERFKDVDLENPNSEGYTYNWGSPLSHDIAWKTVEVDDEPYTFVCVHIGNDARWGFTYWVVLQGSVDDMLEVEYYPSVEIGDELYVDLKWYTECYSIYDNKNSDDIGEYYQIEYKDLKEELTKDFPDLANRLK